MLKKPEIDVFTVPSVVAVNLVSQYLNPALNVAVLVLTIVFMALGVKLRWRELTEKRPENDQTKDENQ